MINNSAVIVDLNISVWTGRKMDKKVSEQVDADNQTKTRAGNYHKKLLAGTTAFDDVHKLVGAIRQWHYANTLPWADNGQRLLPMANFFDYKAQLSAYEQEFNNTVDKFYQEYNTLVSAAAFSLGNLFDPNDYPSIEEIKGKNSFRYVISPVPDSGDFRVDIPEQYRKELEAISNERVNAAMKDVWDRLHECLSHMSKKLAGNEKQIFRDSLVDNVVELCGMLSKLNVTNDPKLEAARQEVEKMLCGVTPNELRKNDDVRKDVKARVDQILGMF